MVSQMTRAHSQKQVKGRGCDSVVQSLLHMHKALGLSPAPPKKKKQGDVSNVELHTYTYIPSHIFSHCGF